MGELRWNWKYRSLWGRWELTMFCMYCCHLKLYFYVTWLFSLDMVLIFFRILEDVLFKSRKFVRLWSYHSHITSYTNKSVLILLKVFYYMAPLELVKQCLSKPFLIIPMPPSSGLWVLNLCRSILARYEFVICSWSDANNVVTWLTLFAFENYVVQVLNFQYLCLLHL